MEQIALKISSVLTDYVMVWCLIGVAVWFTVLSRGVQFRMFAEMCRVLLHSGRKKNIADASPKHSVSSFQAFALSIASRVGTGNLAGVATAIAIGGPGAVFWMWITALLGASSAFVESTLAQLFKVRSSDSFLGGPAYYILKGLGQRWWAVLFAVLITLTFGFAFNTVQSNTISGALNESFGISTPLTGILLGILTIAIIFGGIGSIARFSEIIVPAMAIAYILLAGVIMLLNAPLVPKVFMLIVDSAFNFDSALGGTFGMAVILGVKRGLFSNEAGEGSTPNAAATASVSHPVKQGLLQTLGVYTDTLLICSATAFIILCSGQYVEGYDGIVLTQRAIDAGLGGTHHYGSTFVSIAVFFFAFTSIIANYYYGEANIRFMTSRPWVVTVYRVAVGVMVVVGAMMSLEMVWLFADITMAMMTICNLAAIILLGKYAMALLRDYQRQRRAGLDPRYVASTIPEIASQTECWRSEEDVQADVD